MERTWRSISLGGGPKRSTAGYGGRSGPSSGGRDRHPGQHASGTRGPGRDHDNSHCLQHRRGSGPIWTCCQPEPTGRHPHGRHLLEHRGRTEAAGAAARVGAHGNCRWPTRHPTNPNLAEPTTKNLRAAAHTLGLQLHILHASNERDFDTVFATLGQLRAGALVIGADPFFSSRLEQLAALTVRHAVPTVYQSREFTAAGGLMGYGASFSDAFRAAGVYTGRILKGDKPADLPVQQLAKVELIINLKTAKALGLTIPLPLLGRADEVIE